MAELRRVIVELSHSKKLEESRVSRFKVATPTLDTKVLPKLEGVSWDEGYPPVELPGFIPREESGDPRDVSTRFAIDENIKNATFIVRGVVEDEAGLKALEASAAASNLVVQVFADVEVQETLICPGSPAMGTDKDVEKLLCTAKMHECGLDGSGVLVAVVDTGINMEYLLSQGKRPYFDAARSWVPQANLIPGHLPVHHGTMVAYDVCIAAPRCTLLDIALLLTQQQGGTVMSGLLSDAVRAYRHLLDIMLAPRRPGEGSSLVVNNSWGMFHPSWDFPVGHPGNYSDNPNHPFNRIVGALELAGADILFAAGNCGNDCPDGRCQGVTNQAIYGANSHPQVLSVAGVGTDKVRVGYSAIGPGRLERNKPDISGYTHFRGSGVFAADGGTSAASPVVAGVVAALRSKMPYDPGAPGASPAAIRNIIIKTAEDRGLVGYDFEYGWGIVNGCRLAELNCKEEPEPEDRCCCCYCWHGKHRRHSDCGYCHKANCKETKVICEEEPEEDDRPYYCGCSDKRRSSSRKQVSDV